jgi:hypothetical protein
LIAMVRLRNTAALVAHVGLRPTALFAAGVIAFELAASAMVV